MAVVRTTKSYSLYCFSSLGLLCLALHAFTSAVICGALRCGPRRLQSEARGRRRPQSPVRGRRRPQSGRRRLQSGRQWIIASSYCSCLATRHSSTLLSASLFSAILNRRGGWLPTLAGFTLGTIAGCHAGCHCHCWVPC